MKSDDKKESSHAGIPSGKNPATSSDRVQAPVAGAGLMDCGRGQSSSRQNRNTETEEVLPSKGEKEERKLLWDRHEEMLRTLLNVMETKRSVTVQHKDLTRRLVASLQRLRRIYEEDHPRLRTMSVGTIHAPVFPWPPPSAEKEGDKTESVFGSTESLPWNTKDRTPVLLPENKKRKDRTPPEHETPAKKKGPKQKKPEEKATGGEKPEAKEPGKRPAEPPENDDGDVNGEFQEPRHRKSRRKKKKGATEGKGEAPRRKPPKRRSRPTLPDAVVIKVKEVASYANVLKKVQGDTKLTELGEACKKIHRSAKGDMMIVTLQKKTTPEKMAQFRTELEDVLGEEAEVRGKVSEVAIEIKDLDEIVTPEVICAALTRELGSNSGITLDVVKSLRQAYRGTQTAVVVLAAEAAKKILATGKVKINWTVCPVREKVRPMKCFKCWYYGHLARNCKEKVDRAKDCMKCGKAGHKINECRDEPSCVLCKEKSYRNCGHIAGGGRCPIYTQALQEMTRNQK